MLSLLSFLLLVSSVTAASHYGRRLLPAKPHADADRGTTEQAAQAVQELVVEPGDTELEQGAALTVVARFPGPAPEKVVLEFAGVDAAARKVSMS
ncbi:MAG: hypothetical protein ACK5YO_18865, partial [Planctomyces sp.]